VWSAAVLAGNSTVLVMIFLEIFCTYFFTFW
jgi:hypothetical protein